MTQRVVLALHIRVTDEERLVAAATEAAAAQGITYWPNIRTGLGDDLLMLLNAGSRGEDGYMVDGVWWE